MNQVTAAVRQLAYGTSSDAIDEYVRISESTARVALKKFCAAVVKSYEHEYLRDPTEDDMKRLLDSSEKAGWPGCWGSIDCTRWVWKNCPIGWKGQFVGKNQVPEVVLEAIASNDLWIWHCHFGVPGSCNDINVLDRSEFLQKLSAGEFPEIPYRVGGRLRLIPYLLADGIYPEWSVFVKTFASPDGRKNSHFAKRQEARRKEVERAFGVLKAKFGILTTPCRLWFLEEMSVIMKACIILHNMSVEERVSQEELLAEDAEEAKLAQEDPEEKVVAENDDEVEAKAQDPVRLNPVTADRFIEDTVRNLTIIRNTLEHDMLREALVNHLWAIRRARRIRRGLDPED